MGKKHIWNILFITVVCLAVYANIFKNDFVFDDRKFILDKYEIKHLSFIPNYFTRDVDGLYRPLRTVLYAFTYAIWGENPIGYHLNSLIFHITNTILVYFIINLIVKRRDISLVSALIFAVHPIHTERVTNMTASFDMLGILFFLLTFFFYVRYRESGKLKYYIITIFTLILTFLSSEEALTLPFIFILYDFSFRKINSERVKKYIPFFAILVFYIIIRYFVLGTFARAQQYAGGGFYSTLLTMTKVYVQYIFLLFVPYKLSLYRVVPVAKSLAEPYVILSLVFLLILLFFAIFIYKKSKLTFFFILWFFITLIPMSNIVPLYTMMAERYLYLPSVSFSFLLGFIFYKFYNIKTRKNSKGIFCVPGMQSIPRKIKIITIILLIFIILSYSVVTFKRNSDWRNDLTLWTKTVKTSPLSSSAHDNLGSAYEQLGNHNNAMPEFKEAIRLDPLNYQAHYNLGVSYADLKEFDLAISEFETSISLNQNFYRAYDSIGLIYLMQGNISLAIMYFEESVKKNPFFAKAHSDLGVAYAQSGNYETALRELERAIEIEPYSENAHYNLGLLYQKIGKDDLAKKEFEIAAKLR